MRRFVRPVRRPARAAPSLHASFRGPAPAGGGACTTSGRADARRARRARLAGRCAGSPRAALSVSLRPRSRAALRRGFGIVSFVPSVAPRAPLSRSEAPRRRVGRAPRAGAQAHVERGACGRPAGVLGVRAPRAHGESAAAFTRRSLLGVWHIFVRPVRRPAAATPRPRDGGWGAHHERARGRTPSATRAVDRREGLARHALSVSLRPSLRAALCLGFGVVSFVPSVAPPAPLSRSEAPRRRVERTPRADARTHAERDARYRSELGVRAPRALGEVAAAFARRASLGVWRSFDRPVRRPARAALSFRGPAPAGRAHTTSGRAGARRARRVR